MATKVIFRQSIRKLQNQKKKEKKKKITESILETLDKETENKGKY